MKKVPVLLLLVFTSFAAQTAAQDVKALYVGHHWFALRDEIQRHGGLVLYRGAVAASFNQQSEAERDLLALISSQPESDEAYDAHEWLSYMYTRVGKYREAAAQIKAKRTARPDRAKSENELALMKLFEHLPDQSVECYRSSTLRFSSEHDAMVVPLFVNGYAANFTLDSGANVSVLSEAEARRMKLKVEDSHATMMGAAGEESVFRFAIAREMTIGKVKLRNVAFLVFADDHEPFNSYPMGRRGALGLPVFIAMKTLQWGKNGSLRIAAPAKGQSTSSNLCFDGSDSVFEMEYEQQKLDAVLDTGSEETALWPPFAKHFPEALAQSGTKGSQEVSGIGATRSFDSMTLPEIRLKVDGFDTVLRPAHVLLKETTPNSNWYYARAGLDLLNQASTVTVDFGSMRISLR